MPIQLSDLSFVWPRLLWLLLLVPALVTLYVVLVARRRRTDQRYAGLLSSAGMDSPTGFGGHLPPLLMLLGLCAMLIAVARPQATLALPQRLESVILAIDTSGSMRATDLAPTRIAAAQSAAKAFVAEQPPQVRIGVVAIAATAALVQSPTLNRQDLVGAIDRLQTQRGSALGSGLVIALDSVRADAKLNVEELIGGRPPGAPPVVRVDGAAPTAVERPEQPANDAVIVLLSDGQSNLGPDPLKAAALAADLGVRIHTVGLGTRDGTVVNVEGWSGRARLDEATLRKIAGETQGEYFAASDAEKLKKIYRSLGSTLAFGKRQTTEITAIVVALGALLVTLAAMLSLWRFNRIL